MLSAVLGGLVAACGGTRPLPEGNASVTISEPALFYEAGQAMPLRVTFYNAGDATLTGGEDVVDGRALEVLDGAGRTLSPKPPGGRSPTPLTLPPGERREVSIDAAALFADLAAPGTYLLTAVYPRFRSNAVSLRVLPPYRADVRYAAEVETDLGSFRLRFHADVAPRHVRNFIDLARLGFYDGTLIHRIVPGRLIQGGDPGGTGTGGPGYTLEPEFSDRPHLRGTLSMARRPDVRDSAGSQWFICLDRLQDLDGHYTVFGEVSEGMQTIDRIAATPSSDDVPDVAIRVRRVSVTEEGP